MGNYVVLDDISDNKVKKTSKTPKSNKKILTFFISIGVFIVVILIMLSRSKNNSNLYLNIEKELLDSAKKYVLNNNIVSTKEMYLDNSKLNIDLPNNCNILSGVIYKNNEYTPYLLCDNYESDIITDNNEMIDLVGNSVILLTKGSIYYDLGYKSEYNVEVSGRVDVNTEGVYNVYYISNIGNSYALRKVIVVDNPTVKSSFPIINLQDELVEIEIGEEYNETVTAIDKTDGNLTDKVIKINNVEDEANEYLNVFSVTNSLGYTTFASQKIIILNSKETTIMAKLDNDNMTNTSVSIMVNVTGDKFNYLILPNGKETKEKDIIYSAVENGNYKFTAIDNNGNSIEKIVKVNNIDKTIPEGKCSVLEYYNKVEYSVSISSFNYIVGYNYINGSHESGYLPYSNYTSKEKSLGNLSVKVKDYIGNEGTIYCTVTEKKSNIEPFGYTTVIRDKPRLHIPIGDALAKKGYTINDLNMCIRRRVEEAGPYTRWGVAAAGYGLIDCTYTMTGYTLAYNHESGKVEETVTDSGKLTNYCTGINKDICGKLGVNSIWGKTGGVCGSDKPQCWHGLNCATFVRWAMCNGGMDLCSKGSAFANAMTNVKYFPEADGVWIINGGVGYYSGVDYSKKSAKELVRMIKPGDAIATDEGGGHTFIVVGYDQNGIYTAEDGYYMRYLKYDDMVKSGTYKILFLDRYYANPNNWNHLYD